MPRPPTDADHSRSAPSLGRRRPVFTTTVGVLALVPPLLALLGVAAAPPTSDDVPEVREVRTVATATMGVPTPAGVAYVPSRDELVVSATDGVDGTTLLRMGFDENALGRVRLPAVSDPASLALDPAGERLTMVHDGQLVAVPVSELGAPRATVTPTGTAPPGRPTVPGAPDLRGPERNPNDGLRYVASQRRARLYALDEAGTVRRTWSLASLELGNLQDLTFAPSSDTSDAADSMNLFLADAGTATSTGGIIEVTLATVTAAAAPTVTATLVQSIDTSRFVPPSPDPAGIVHLPAPDRLLVADSEVDETTGAGYHGVNLWLVTRSGSATASGTTLPWSNEPTGLGHDAATNTLFVSSDSGNRVYVVRPGGNGAFGDGDDQLSWIRAGDYGVRDTEDPEFDPTTGHLFFLDGVSTEVYRVNPVDGVFGNGNDVVTHFDVGRYGATDTEALGSNRAAGTLLVGDRKSKRIYEVTTTGALVRIIDASGVSGMKRLSGLGTAPASDGSGRTRIWTVDRAVDNDSRPTENDGRLFELAVDLGGGTTNTPPVVNAGPDVQVALGSAATLDGTVTDDGLPNPPGSVTTRWSRVSGPGTASFSNETAVDTTATFSTAGTYVLRLTADDGAASASDDVTVTVLSASGTVTVQRRVAARADDAEEGAAGAVDIGSSDLELVRDGGVNQVVGMRFTGLGVPRGATVIDARIQFTVDETPSNVATLTIRGEAVDSSAPFTTAAYNVSSRAATGATVPWAPPVWTTVGAAGPDQRTPNLAAIVQEIVDRPGWTSGNAVTLIVTGTGERVAEAFNSTPDLAPLLIVTYEPT